MWFIFKNKEEFKRCVSTAKKYFPYDVRHEYFEALFLYKEGKTQEAITKLTEFLKKAPNDTNGLQLKTMIHLNSKEYEDAYQTTERIVSSKEKEYLKIVISLSQGNSENVLVKLRELNKTELRDERLIVLYHSLETFDNSKDGKSYLTEKKSLLQNYIYKSYADFYLGKIDLKKLFKSLKQRIYLRSKIYFYQGLRELSKGQSAKAKEYFQNCLHPYTINHPEHQLAKSYLEKL